MHWNSGRTGVKSANLSRSSTMGKGDKRTAKGKRFKSSYGNSRPQGKKAVKKSTGKKTAKKA
jgi:30S ribosomal protein S31